MKDSDIFIMSCVPPVLRVLSLAADSVAHLSVCPPPVVVLGPHRNILWRQIYINIFQHLIANHLVDEPLTQ